MNTAGLRAALVVVAALLAGCREEETITTQEVPRLTPRPRTFSAEEAAASLDHMLAAIVPHGEKGWFFKLVAPAPAAEELRKPFEEFIGSVQLGDAGGTPKWTLPEGWTEKPGGEMRAATIEVPHGGEKYELAVSSLPFDGKLPPYVEANVNRWLGQLQQAPLDGKSIAKLTRTASLKGGEATLVELVGVMERQSMALPAGHPPVAPPGEATAATTSAARSTDGETGEAKAASSGTTESAGAAAPRQPPMAGSMGGGVAPADEFAKPTEFTYTPPSDWKPGQTTSMRKAAFIVADGNPQTGVTVTQFPAKAAMTDPIAQAQRWAGEAELRASDDELRSLMEETEIDGATGQMFELLGSGARGVRAAMVQRGDVVWFFKMTGERELVESQREEFAAFLESVKFAK
jgi:hypothetical protein